jgi:hypothetical protein
MAFHRAHEQLAFADSTSAVDNDQLGLIRIQRPTKGGELRIAIEKVSHYLTKSRYTKS